MIKLELKKHNITLSQFCDDFNISRPTLNNYIKLYEENEELPSEVFQRIFDYLFDGEVSDSFEFLERYSYVQDYYHRKYTNRFTNDLLGYNNLSERNYNSLLMTIERDKVEKRISDDKFMMINYILKNDDEILDKYIDFFMCYKGTKKFNESKYKDNKFIVLLFNAMKKRNDKMKQDEFSLLHEFIKLNDELYNKKTPNKYSKKLSKRLATLIEEKYGYLSDEDIEEVLNELGNKITNEVGRWKKYYLCSSYCLQSA